MKSFLFEQVQQNGLLQHWQYKADYTWKCVSENYICIYQSAEVTDVCLNVAQNALYWCEGRVSDTSERPIYCICKRLMNDRKQLFFWLSFNIVTLTNWSFVIWLSDLLGFDIRKCTLEYVLSHNSRPVWS